jgi:hypothetical protein
MTQELTKVTTFIIRNHEWVIIHASEAFEGDSQDRHYMGVRREWITDGRLNRQLNGIQSNLSKTVAEVIDHITDLEEVDYLAETTDMTREEACMAYFKKKWNLG